MKAVTFGEIMMRLTPRDNDLLVHANSYNSHFGGSEFNTAAGLKALGVDSKFITRLPENPIGHRAHSAILAAGVKTTDDIFAPEGRMGLYYLEMGSSPRPSRVVYDRAGASIAITDASSYDWKKYLDGATWFHVSGITPALGPAPYKATVEAIKTASEMGIPISFDINFRIKLWSVEDARKLLTPMLKKCDVIISTEEDLERVFGIDAGTPEQIAGKAREFFSIDTLAITLRITKTVKTNLWSGCAYGADGFHMSRMYDLEIIDRVGAGDSFSAGLIAGLIENKNLEYSVNLASAFSALKQTIPGDICSATRSQAEELMEKGSAGRIQR